MKNIAVVISLALVVSAAACKHSSASESASTPRAADTAATSASHPPFAPRAASLAEQKMCDDQARKRFREDSDGITPFNRQHMVVSEFHSHYDPAVNVCYLRIDRTFYYEKYNLNASVVFDAFEEHWYASYLSTEPDKTQDFTCSVTLPGKAPIICRSRDDFNGLVGKYFGLVE